jgi:ADP-ribosylglycohydrolase
LGQRVRRWKRPDRRTVSCPSLSDDTWLTVATCDAVVAATGQVNPAIIADEFRARFETGRLRGLGSSTLKALTDLVAGSHWAFAGARGEYAAGAGAAMRIAPLAFLLDPDSHADRVLIRDVARITHHSEEAYAGALAVLAAVRMSGAAGSVPEDMLSLLISLLPDSVCAIGWRKCLPLTRNLRLLQRASVRRAMPWRPYRSLY